MKKLPLLVFALAVGSFFFFVSPVKAATIYAQLNDSGSTINLPPQSAGVCQPQLIATFTPTQNYLLMNPSVSTTTTRDAIYFLYQMTGGSGGLGFYISSSTPIDTAHVVNSTGTGSLPETDGIFVPHIAQNWNFTSYVISGHTYYIYGCLSANSPVSATLEINTTKSLYYGFLTDDGGANQAFYDQYSSLFGSGFASTTQQVMCASNLTGTSSLLSQVSSDFSVGICNASVFLFVPNQDSINNWTNIGTTTAQKFPFSWVLSVTSVLGGLTASSTANAPSFNFALHDLGIGSTSPIGNLMPNFSGFSTTTVETYLTPDLLSLFKALASLALVTGLILDIFFTSRNLI